MTKGLEVWYLVKKYLEKEHHKIFKEDIPLKSIEGMPLDIIEKELKALEIIKSKELNVFFIKRYTREDFNFMCRYEQRLTKEEYDLLKEVLL